MIVLDITLEVSTTNPGDLPRLGETFTISLPRMTAPQEFTVAAADVKRRWVDEGGDDEGFIYEGSIELEAVDDDEDDVGEAEPAPEVGSQQGASR